MRTWRNLGGRAKLDLFTSVTSNDSSGYVSGRFCRAYKGRCSPVRQGVSIKSANILEPSDLRNSLVSEVGFCAINKSDG
ncbi:hypothetical protein TNCV_3078611 [Trichonephila clavipes]|nr:hypothetical protein TNCV_3078611 [Trichonephila clavipes]